MRYLRYLRYLWISLKKIGYTPALSRILWKFGLLFDSIERQCKHFEWTKRLNRRLCGGNWGWLGWTVVVWISLWNFVIWIIGIYGFVEIFVENLRNKILSLVKWTDPYYVYYVVNFLSLFVQQNLFKDARTWIAQKTFKWICDDDDRSGNDNKTSIFIHYHSLTSRHAHIFLQHLSLLPQKHIYSIKIFCQ